ncbi:MAG: hypothetical protein ACYCOO_12205 [Chitinophagaceae bacterium]
MEVITIESHAFQMMLAKIDALHLEVSRMQNPVNQFSLEWVDTYNVLKMLNIFKRTLSNYNEMGKLQSTRINNKSYFKIKEIYTFFEGRQSQLANTPR